MSGFNVWVLVGPTVAPAGINGQVADNTGTPLGSVSMTLNGSTNTLQSITNSAGRYSFSELAVGELYAAKWRSGTTNTATPAASLKRKTSAFNKIGACRGI